MATFASRARPTSAGNVAQVNVAGLNELELAVLEKMLQGDGTTLEVLREQARVMRLQSRELTGVGWFLDFEVPPEAPLVSPPAFELDCNAEIEGLRHGAGFVLFVRNGKLEMLEAFTYDEPWPEEVTGFTLSS